jgi:hypothetical protein
LVAFIDPSEDVYEYMSLEEHFPGAIDLTRFLTEEEPISETAEDAWGDGWVEITALGDEYRRFRTSDGKIIEVPFGEHQEEDDG